MISRMRQTVGVTVAVAVACSATWAADVDVSVTSGGSSTAVVSTCGAPLAYEVTGVLSDTLNEGLAGFLLDLRVTGGSLAPADTPVAEPMVNFACPNGINGANGFGGTIVGSTLTQVGGTQNTVKNPDGRLPCLTGPVAPGVAHTETVLVTGTLTAPVVPGIHTLTVSGLTAVVIKKDETGEPFWATEPAGVGAISNLTVQVLPPDPPATASNSEPTCPSDDVTLLGGSSGMVSYAWTGPNGFTATEQNPVVSPAAAGAYTLTITDASNGTGTANTSVITNPAPDASAEGPRYLAVTPAACADDVAFLVTGDAGDPSVSCVSLYVQADGTLGVTPVYQTPASWRTIMVSGEQIIPGRVYHVQTDYCTAGAPPSATTTATTWRWGDVNNGSGVDLNDILCVLDGSSGFYQLCTRQAVDLLGTGPTRAPDGTIDLDDILAVLDAFSRKPHPCADPCL